MNFGKFALKSSLLTLTAAVFVLLISKTWFFSTLGLLYSPSSSSPAQTLRDNWRLLLLVGPATALLYYTTFPKIFGSLQLPRHTSSSEGSSSSAASVNSDTSHSSVGSTNTAAFAAEDGSDGSKRTKIRKSLGNIMDGISSNLRGFRVGSKRDPRLLKLYEKADELGGNVGGLVNDGNTCFMNSVLQSLASSNELMDFLGFCEGNPDCKFSNSLKQLLDKLNDKHGNKNVTYNTKSLLKSLANGPQRHLFLGYNQEDAQEFYQMLMKELEKDFQKLHPTDKSIKKPKFVSKTDSMMYGSERLGDLGTVYVPSSQVDPNFEDPEKVFPMELVTPVDGLQCERIGCLTCGEMGGLRYSVISGLGLNLPPSNKASYDIHELLNDWIQPEVIDGVECNRCGLVQVSSVLQSQVESMTNEKLRLLTQERIKEINSELSKPIIDDDVYSKLHTKNMVQKSRKVKQILFSRPPPLLSIHVNRSVFDPKTYMVRKNGAQVNFPAHLDLSDYIAEPNNINTDARLSFKKSKSPELIYSLKSVISHFGTHNYGHYISYRKYRGIWWRISDETVGVCTEKDVLMSQGTFMLFYELSDRNDPRDNFGADEEEEEEDAESDEVNMEEDEDSDASSHDNDINDSSENEADHDNESSPPLTSESSIMEEVSSQITEDTAILTAQANI